MKERGTLKLLSRILSFLKVRLPKTFRRKKIIRLCGNDAPNLASQRCFVTEWSLLFFRDVLIVCQPVVLLKENCAMNLTSFGQFLDHFFKLKRKVAVEIMFLFPPVRPCICVLLSAPTLLFFFLNQTLDNLDTKYVGKFPVFSHFDLLQTSFT
jgi:hypothetical protein